MGDTSLSRRRFLQLAGAGSAVALARAMGLPGPPGNAAAAKPNVVLILADDLGYGELGCQGAKDIPTPFIDSIAASGVRFTDGYVSCPVCSPTRAGLLTGRYQQRFGHEFNPGNVDAAAPFGLPKEETLLPERLKEAGYRTALVGKWHLGVRQDSRPLSRGFDEFFGFLGGAHAYVPAGDTPANPIYRGDSPVKEQEYLTDAFAREAEAFIDRNHTRPFFLYLAFNAVHSPLQAPEKYTSRFSSIPAGNRRTFAAMLSAMDDAVGKVLQALRRHGIEENTLIIFLSDNGGPTRQTTSSNGPLRGFKGQVLEGGIRVPFMMQWKGRVPAGKTLSAPVISLDIAPTVLAAAGISQPAGLDGKDLLPFLAQEQAGSPHDALFWRFGDQKAVRRGDWKLVTLPAEGTRLYNLSSDIGEAKDLSAANDATVREMTGLLEDWEKGLRPPAWKRAPARQTRPAARQQRNTTPRRRKTNTAAPRVN